MGISITRLLVWTVLFAFGFYVFNLNPWGILWGYAIGIVNWTIIR